MNGYNNNIEYMKLFLVDRLKEAITECSHWSFEYASYFVAKGEVILRSSDTHHPREPPWSIEIEPIQEWEESATKVMQLSIDVYGSNACGKGELHFGAEAHFFGDNRPPEVCGIREFVSGVPHPLT